MKIGMESMFKRQLNYLHGRNKWLKVQKMIQHDDSQKLSTFIWVIPRYDDFMLIRNILYTNFIKKIISLGCGTGLLEWLMENLSGEFANINLISDK